MPVELKTVYVTVKSEDGKLRETFGIVATSRQSAISHAHVLFAQRYGEKAVNSQIVGVKETSNAR